MVRHSQDQVPPASGGGGAERWDRIGPVGPVLERVGSPVHRVEPVCWFGPLRWGDRFASRFGSAGHRIAAVGFESVRVGSVRRDRFGGADRFAVTGW
ncbi:hypothetical protein DEF23_23230 [Marinitenerispora sediminis]|uniref:Uncharacterized protein n=1 Tax=Marinitenerispora sediminis TaxID=1931232 RepID=A0A368T9L4_9ACTN|nr:hypothetical protein DEF23_23230 [Marinitenerispora sediminis]RCV59271.1 hypothetical protein DEF24_09875 [Marinitenerispora sediminis]